MDNWYTAWRLAQAHNADLLESVKQQQLSKGQSRRIGWPRWLALLR